MNITINRKVCTMKTQQQPTTFRRGDLIAATPNGTSFMAQFWYRSCAGANVLLYKDGNRHYAEFVQDAACRLEAKADPTADELPGWAI